MTRTFRASDWVRVVRAFTWTDGRSKNRVKVAYCPRSIWSDSERRQAWVMTGRIPPDTPEMVAMLEEQEIETTLIAQGAIDPY